MREFTWGLHGPSNYVGLESRVWLPPLNGFSSGFFPEDAFYFWVQMSIGPAFSSIAAGQRVDDGGSIQDGMYATVMHAEVTLGA